ncbi:hypothetical protein T484DRAFT_1796985, partial [Baffinella frigidus]
MVMLGHKNDERVAAMVMLGHKNVRGEGAAGDEEGQKTAAQEEEEKKAAAAAKKAKELEAAPTGLSEAVELKLLDLFDIGKCKRSDLDATTLAKLKEFPDSDALDILARFAEAE